jgi:DNA polymerase-3 subunit delta
MNSTKSFFQWFPGTSITVNDVEKNIGISKDYNTFELTNALGNRNVLKANQIINYFIDNEKMHALPPLLGNLFSYFRKILLFHSLENKNDRNEIARKLGVSPYFVNDYIQASKSFPLDKAIVIISLMRETDLRSKGARGGSTENGELLRELIYKILHL